MEFNEAKKELESYYAMELSITQLESLIETKKQKANKLSTTISHEPRSLSKHPDGMAEKLSSALDLEAEMTERINQMKAKQDKIMDKMLRVEQPYQNVLFCIYALGNSIEVAASIVGYCRTHLYKKRDKGIELYAKL